METSQFDSTLGGTENLPYSANSLKFAASRSVEIAALTESILRPSKTKLIFQTLPVHMRRRVMSHNSKRLPRKLRAGHLEQLKKSGLPPPQKRPSRKYRRRPANLLQEYLRRQKQNIWLETHIWHAKRFHMIKRWGYRLPYAPCDKAFRACYRASSAHCLLQDISYYIPVKITGTLEEIRKVFNQISSCSCGLSIHAKAFISGKREGSILIFKPNSYPYGFIGKIFFLWLPSDSDEARNLVLFVHPSHIKQTETVLKSFSKTNYENPKRRKLNNLEVINLSGKYNRFRLTGPNSHAVLVQSLKCIENIDDVKTNKWISMKNNYKFYFPDKSEYWKSISKASSPSQLPSSVVIGLTVRDPRLCRPHRRTKANKDSSEELAIEATINIPDFLPDSPLWDLSINEVINNNKMSNHKFIEHVTKTQLVPGEVFIEDPKLQCIPIVLIQRPGSQNSSYKKIGYGSGWDIIIPSGYGLPFWQTFIMFGARSGGLRETESLCFEMGETFLPPDSKAGVENEKRIQKEMSAKYFRRPPSKRVNYIKLAVNTPFICPWNILLNDWKTLGGNSGKEDFFVLRDKQILNQIQICINKKIAMPRFDNADKCLLAVCVKLSEKGNLRNHALICAPLIQDLQSVKTLFEPHHEDPNEKLRKEKRTEHRKNVKRMKKKSKKDKMKKTVSIKTKKLQKLIKSEPSAYVKSMRELWLPTQIVNVRNSCSRQILGYIAQGAFSFTEAHSCGVGYIAFNALSTLLHSGLNKVLIRNTTSFKYRIGNIQVIV